MFGEEMNGFDYRITEDVFEWIAKGTKRIEVRLYNLKSSKINLGDTITFTTVPNDDKVIKVKVTSLLRYPDIENLSNDFGMDLIADKLHNLLSDYDLWKEKGQDALATANANYEMKKWYYQELGKLFNNKLNKNKLLKRYNQIMEIYFQDN